MNTMTDQAARPAGSTGIITGVFEVILLFWFFHVRIIPRLNLFFLIDLIFFSSSFLCVDEVISSNVDCTFCK